MADIYYMSGKIKDNINGKLIIIRKDLEFSKIVIPNGNDLCIFKSDNESFFCHILNDKTDQFDVPLAITGTTEQDIKKDIIHKNTGVSSNTNPFEFALPTSQNFSNAIMPTMITNPSTNSVFIEPFKQPNSNTLLQSDIPDNLREYNNNFLGNFSKELDNFNEKNKNIANLYLDLKGNLSGDKPLPRDTLKVLKNNINIFKNNYKDINYKDFIKDLLELNGLKSNVEILTPYFQSFSSKDKIYNIFDYLIIKFYYFIYDAKKITHQTNIFSRIDNNLFEIRNKTYNQRNYLNDFTLYYIFEDVIKINDLGYINISDYIKEYNQPTGNFNIIRERLKIQAIFNFIKTYFINYPYIDDNFAYKNPYFCNIQNLLKNNYTTKFENDDNAISFILSIIDFITISLFDPNYCKIHDRYYEHPNGTAMFYNILISNQNSSLTIDAYDEYFSSSKHDNITKSFGRHKLSLTNYDNWVYNFKINETDNILLAYLISYFKHIKDNDNNSLDLRNIIKKYYFQEYNEEYLNNFKLYILYINSIISLDSSKFFNFSDCLITTCIKTDIKNIDIFINKINIESKYKKYIEALAEKIIDKDENNKFLQSYLKKIFESSNPLPTYLTNYNINHLLNSLSKVDSKSTDVNNKLNIRRMAMVFILDHIYNKNFRFTNDTSWVSFGNSTSLGVSFSGGGTLNFIRDIDNVKIILNKIEDKDVISTIYSHEIKNDKPLIEFYNLLTPNNIKNIIQYSTYQTQSSKVGGKNTNKKYKRAKKNANTLNIKGGLPLVNNGQPITGQLISEHVIKSPVITELGNGKVDMDGKRYNKVETTDSVIYVPDDDSFQQSSQISFPSKTSNIGSELYSEDKIFDYVWNYSNSKLIRFNGYFNMIYDSYAEDIFGNKDKYINKNINIKFFKYFIEKSDYIKRVINEKVTYNEGENNEVTVILINTIDNQINKGIYVYSKETFAKFFDNNSNLNNKIIAKIYNTPNGGDIYIFFDILVDIFKDYISVHLEEQKNKENFTSLNRYLKFVIDYYKTIDKLQYFSYYVDLENWLYHIKSISVSGTATEIIDAYKNELKIRIVICNAIISKSDNNNIKKYLELLQYTLDNIGNITEQEEYANRIKNSCEKQLNRVRYYGENFIFD